MNKIIILSVFILFNYLSVGYSMEWKVLHSRADNISLAGAQEAINKNPASAVDQYVLGLVYFNLHQDQAAYQIFKELLRNEPNMIEAKWGLAEALRRKHESKEAEKLINEVLKVNPQFAPALISLAYIKYFQMDFTGAVRLAAVIIQQGAEKTDLSNYVRAYCIYAGSKGMLAHYGGLFSKAIDGFAIKPNLEKAQKMQPDSPEVLFGLGSFYLLAPGIAGGDKSKAQEYFNQAVKVDPLFADVYVRFAQLAKIKGDKEKYNFYMNKALELDPQNELAQDTLSARCKFICTGGKD